jgi:hypothetical protein
MAKIIIQQGTQMRYMHAHILCCCTALNAKTQGFSPLILFYKVVVVEKRGEEKG